ncbi:PREDICTED: uncharacterized protein C19orf71 homolog [Thamnophis sirtalis]|uniref:Uncharacterized protein C19orf71 homolog n=1 Tax=Thamnophis sirtalis TaxID=35019 RepID=A0A6I9YBL7_9SAUR|nr:PREDICTED: uncharacterized protein C19orf71 homolog [Thamnophis sirtalis]
MDFHDLSHRDLVLNRPYVPLNTLETNFPTPLYSDQYLSLRGPRNAPVIKEAVRWKFTPMGWDAIPQTWYTGLTNSRNRDAWYAITEPLGRETHHRWQRSGAKQEKALPPVVNRNRSAEELKGKPGYVPHLSLHTPVFTAKDYRTWRMFGHQPSTNNQ